MRKGEDAWGGQGQSLGTRTLGMDEEDAQGWVRTLGTRTVGRDEDTEEG